MANISSNIFILAITRVFLGLMLLGRSYTAIGAPTRAPYEYIETPATSILQLHEYLSDATQELARHASNVFHGYKTQRFGPEAEIDTRSSFTVSGLPPIQHLEETRTMLGYSEEDLLRTHKSNLGIYYQAMESLILDESLNIRADHFLRVDLETSNFYDIRDHIAATIRKIDDIIIREGFRGENRTPAKTTLSFHTERVDNVRNVRDLCVLFEIYKYTNDVLYVDVKRHESVHRAEDAMTER